MIRELAVYERSSCRCGPCSTICTSGQSGALAPSDLDHIAEFFGMEDPSEEFMAQNFVASEAVLDGESTRVIRPNTRSDGRCLFLQGTGAAPAIPWRRFSAADLWHVIRSRRCRRSGRCVRPSTGRWIIRRRGSGWIVSRRQRASKRESCGHYP
jgi:hypothetical protein